MLGARTRELATLLQTRRRMTLRAAAVALHGEPTRKAIIRTCVMLTELRARGYARGPTKAHRWVWAGPAGELPTLPWAPRAGERRPLPGGDTQ